MHLIKSAFGTTGAACQASTGQAVSLQTRASMLGVHFWEQPIAVIQGAVAAAAAAAAVAVAVMMKREARAVERSEAA